MNTRSDRGMNRCTGLNGLGGALSYASAQVFGSLVSLPLATNATIGAIANGLARGGMKVSTN